MAGAASFSHVHDWTMDNAPAGTGSWFGWANAMVSELIPLAAGLEARRRKATYGNRRQVPGVPHPRRRRPVVDRAVRRGQALHLGLDHLRRTRAGVPRPGETHPLPARPASRRSSSTSTRPPPPNRRRRQLAPGRRGPGPQRRTGLPAGRRLARGGAGDCTGASGATGPIRGHQPPADHRTTHHRRRTLRPHLRTHRHGRGAAHPLRHQPTRRRLPARVNGSPTPGGAAGDDLRDHRTPDRVHTCPADPNRTPSTPDATSCTSRPGGRAPTRSPSAPATPPPSSPADAAYRPTGNAPDAAPSSPPGRSP